MTIELASTPVKPRPWGVCELKPWNATTYEGIRIGEIWYERPGNPAVAPSLLLKLLLTSQPLSIQVHPDDTYAHSLGLPNGKTEAWYVLSAEPGAKVAVGLNRQVSTAQLRSSIDDGSISELIAWRAVSTGEIIYVPAGTIHAIGAGLIIAEIQQRSDTTFRIFDQGRQRELHVDDAMAVSKTGRAESQVAPSKLTHQRTLLIANPHFVFERIVLPADSIWDLAGEREAWLFVISGGAVAGALELGKADAMFIQTDVATLTVGSSGLEGLVAYTGVAPLPHLLRRLSSPRIKDDEAARHQLTASPSQGRADQTSQRMGTGQ